MAFLAGIYAPLGSPCVLPLFPGFLAFLAGKCSGSGGRTAVFALGLTVVAGVLVSMLAFGMIFTMLVQVSLARFLSFISPIAFFILALFSTMLILNVDPGRLTGGIPLPRSGRSFPDAFLLGLFFGIIILPCNAVAVVALLAIGTTTTGLLANVGSFLSFGIGMSLPILLFASLSGTHSREILAWFSLHRRAINLVAGIVMLGVALYYLLFVFCPVSQ